MRIERKNFPLIGATVGLFRISDGRSFETVRREFAADGSVRSVQPNFRFFLQQQKATPAEGDQAQYALAKLRLPKAHKLAHGTDVRVAVIDSGIDAKHHELAGAIVDSFDALATKEGPHVHGTGIAGAIAAHARLMGSAPGAHRRDPRVRRRREQRPEQFLGDPEGARYAAARTRGSST